MFTIYLFLLSVAVNQQLVFYLRILSETQLAPVKLACSPKQGFLGLWLLYASIAQGCRRRLRLGVWPVAEPDPLEKIIELCKAPGRRTGVRSVQASTQPMFDFLDPPING